MNYKIFHLIIVTVIVAGARVVAKGGWGLSKGAERVFKGAGNVDPGQGCWYPTQCRVSPEFVVKIDETVVEDVLSCHKSLEEEIEAQHFRYMKVYGSYYCFLLSDCNQDSDFHGEMSVSGPKYCSEAEFCSVLNPPGNGEIFWTCDVANPYSGPVPVGTTCTASCKSLVNENGHRVVASSSCTSQDTWSQVSYSEGQSTIDLLTPDQPTICNQVTPCSQPFLLDTNPAAAPNTFFYCEKTSQEVIGGATQETPITIAGDDICYLFCGETLNQRYECIEGYWTDNPQDGIFC